MGNTLSFTPVAGFNVLASAWSTTGNGAGSGGTLATAVLGQYYSSSQPLGLGVCAPGVDYSGSISNCTSPNHAIDDLGAIDFVLLTFSSPVTAASFLLDTFGSTQDTDLTYFAGNCISTCSPTGLTVVPGTGTINTSSSFQNGFKSGTFVTGTVLGSNINGTVTDSITLNPNTSVNWILVGAGTNNGSDDFFKLASMTYATAPEPATFGMAGAALAALGLLRRRKNLGSNS